MLRTFTTTSLATLVAASFSLGAVAQDYSQEREHSDKRKNYEDKTIVEVLNEEDRFSKFSEALKEAGMESKLEDGNYTVFAPTNQAFERLPEKTWDGWMNGDSQDQLEKVLSYHIVEERISADDIGESESEYSTMNGENLRVSSSYGSVMVNNRRVVHSDIKAENGYIHGINEILMDEQDGSMRTSTGY